MYPVDSLLVLVILHLGSVKSSDWWCCDCNVPAHKLQRGTGIDSWSQAVCRSWWSVGCSSARYRSLTGKALSIINMYLLIWITIQLGMRYYVRPPCIARIRYLMTCIFRFIYGACSLSAVVLMTVPVISLSKQLNSGSIYIVWIEKPRF